MPTGAIDNRRGLHSDRLDDPSNVAELIYANAWHAIHASSGIPAEIYPAGAADDRLHQVCATLAQWLGTTRGQQHIEDSLGEDSTSADFWHASPDEILPLLNCQDSEMVFGFFEWLSDTEGTEFIIQCQQQINALKPPHP